MSHPKNKEELVNLLIKDGYLKTQSIIDAFNSIDRADFVSETHKNEAYENYPLPIGLGQTISQPLTVAFMLELLEPRTGEKILDIGAGSGWQTALLAQIVGGPAAAGGKIVAIERIPELKNFAEANLSKFGFLEKGLVKLVLGDGGKGYREEAPYDKVIAAAALGANKHAVEAIPQEWKEQLKIGGRIVAPIGESIVMLEKKTQSQFIEKSFFGFSFVPLIMNN